MKAALGIHLCGENSKAHATVRIAEYYQNQEKNPETSTDVRHDVLYVDHRQLTPFFRLTLNTLTLRLRFPHDGLKLRVRQLCERGRRIFDGPMLDGTRQDLRFGRTFSAAEERFRDEVDDIAERHVPEKPPQQSEGLYRKMQEFVNNEPSQSETTFSMNDLTGQAGRIDL